MEAVVPNIKLVNREKRSRPTAVDPSTAIK